MNNHGRCWKAVRGKARVRARMGGLAALALAGLALLASQPSGAAVANGKPKTPLGIGRAYYAGKTITLIQPGSIGGTFDIWALLVAPVMASYLHATINIESITTANTIPAQDTLAASSHNGLTFGEINTIGDIGFTLLHTPALNFNPSHLAFLGGPPLSPQVWVSSSSSPYTTYQSLVDSPARVPMIELSSGQIQVFDQAVNSIFGANIRYVSGYASASLALTGFVRGDAPVTSLAAVNVEPGILAGTIRPLLMTNGAVLPEPFSGIMKNVPTVAEYAKAHPPKTKKQQRALLAMESMLGLPGQLFAMPGATPGDEVTAIRAALEFALKDHAVQSQALAEGVPPGYISGTSAKAGFLEGVKAGAAMASYIALP